MRPILFTLPGSGLGIHSYGVMIFVACSAALAMAVWRARREKVDPNAVYELATWLFLGGVIGARAFYFLQHPEALHHPSDFFRTWQGGNVFYGCIFGGVTGSILYWFRRPFPFWRMADAVAPGVAIGAASGEDRLLPERLLSWLALRPPLGRAFSRRLACLGATDQ